MSIPLTLPFVRFRSCSWDVRDVPQCESITLCVTVVCNKENQLVIRTNMNISHVEILADNCEVKSEWRHPSTTWPQSHDSWCRIDSNSSLMKGDWIFRSKFEPPLIFPSYLFLYYAMVDFESSLSVVSGDVLMKSQSVNRWIILKVPVHKKIGSKQICWSLVYAHFSWLLTGICKRRD